MAFELPPLPWAEDALAPHISAETIEYHYGKHHKTYVDNLNGSVGNIAGVCNEDRNVVGLMPHPERACNPLLGSEDGAVLMRSLVEAAVGASR